MSEYTSPSASDGGSDVPVSPASPSARLAADSSSKSAASDDGGSDASEAPAGPSALLAAGSASDDSGSYSEDGGGGAPPPADDAEWTWLRDLFPEDDGTLMSSALQRRLRKPPASKELRRMMTRRWLGSAPASFWARRVVCEVSMGAYGDVDAAVSFDDVRAAVSRLLSKASDVGAAQKAAESKMPAARPSHRCVPSSHVRELSLSASVHPRRPDITLDTQLVHVVQFLLRDIHGRHTTLSWGHVLSETDAGSIVAAMSPAGKVVGTVRDLLAMLGARATTPVDVDLSYADGWKPLSDRVIEHFAALLPPLAPSHSHAEALRFLHRFRSVFNGPSSTAHFKEFRKRTCKDRKLTTCVSAAVLAFAVVCAEKASAAKKRGADKAWRCWALDKRRSMRAADRSRRAAADSEDRYLEMRRAEAERAYREWARRHRVRDCHRQSARWKKRRAPLMQREKFDLTFLDPEPAAHADPAAPLPDYDYL